MQLARVPLPVCEFTLVRSVVKQLPLGLRPEVKRSQARDLSLHRNTDGDPILLRQISLPKEFDVEKTSLDRHRLVELAASASGWASEPPVVQNMLSSFGAGSLERVWRVENIPLWTSYQEFRAITAAETNLHRSAAETWLWHGTATEGAARAIVESGFDWRLYGKSNGNLHGRGTYFAKSEMLSHSYTKRSRPPGGVGRRFMLLARVVVGKMQKGSSDLKRPGPGFHSATDNPSGPTMVVTFERAQAYPQYLLEYS